MEERKVERGDDAPVEEVTRRPGERRNTGGSGPAPEMTTEELAAHRAEVDAEASEREEQRREELSARRHRSRGSQRRLPDGTEIR